MNYIEWHYSKVWRNILILWRNLTLFPYYYFSVSLHLRTLFAPWHRQKIQKRIGFHLDDILGVISFNVMSRILGAIIKLTVIFYGLLFMAIFSVIWTIPAAIWPVLLGFSLPFYFARGPQEGEEADYFLNSAHNDTRKLFHLLFAHREGKFILSHLGLSEKKLTAAIEAEPVKTPLPSDRPTIASLLQYLAEINPSFKSVLEQAQLKSEDVYETARWYENLYKRGTPLLLDLPRIQNLQGIGHDWAYGYTVELDKYASDLTQKIPTFPILVHREAEIHALERILLKTEGNNVLIVGEPGVARHLLAEILAYRIRSGYIHHNLSHKRVLSLNMHALTSSKPTILEVKGLAKELFTQANTAGNIIICIDEIDKYVSSGADRIDLSDVIAKFAESSVGVIGITTPTAYHQFIKPNSTLSPLFEKVDVNPLDERKSIDVLEFSVSPVLEKKYHVIITYPAIKKTVTDANRFITSNPLPANAIELLDETCVYLNTKNKGTVLTPDHVDEVLTEKLNMPLGNLQKEESVKLTNLENLIHTRIINQKDAISSIAAALRRSRLNIANPNKPVGSFLFLGPTGVGKTETAKALSAVYFGDESKLNRFDMSQYQKEEGLERLIGSAKTGTAGELTSKISDSPFSVLLLDEFEKSDREIYNLFLTLLDEGYIGDSTGKKIFAKNNIIIATSNAGGEFIRERINQGISPPDLQKELVEYVQKEKIFSPELINRFDAVIVFEPLSEGQLREVAKLMLADLNKRLGPKEISVAVTDDLIKKLASAGYDPQFGARSMRRAIQEKIEDQVAQKILANEVHKGEMIQISL